MSVDNDTILPDEKTRHWMLAQTHILMNEGKIDVMNKHAQIEQAMNPDSPHTFNAPTDLDKAHAKKAYNAIQGKLAERDLNSDNLFEDMISEKAFKLDRVSSFCSI